MRTIDIQAYEDRARPGNGIAVLRLSGVSGIAADTTFVLKPADAGAVGDGWPAEAQAPIEVRSNGGATELVLAPALGLNPNLVPGLPLRIDLPAAGLTGEFTWPHVAPASRPRRRMIAPVARADGADRMGATAEPVKPSVVATAAMRPTEEAPAPIAATVTMPPEILPSGRLATRVDGPTTPESPAAAEPGDGNGPFYAHARATQRAPSNDAPSDIVANLMPKTRGAAAAAAVAALLAVQGFAYTLFAPKPAPQPVVAAVPTGLVFDALSAGDIAPSGQSATGVNPARMLELANQNLFADGGARNAEEAGFWLKRYVAATLGDERTRRALTQLGSTYAAPTRGAPDYGLARQTWEIAAAMGDPVAMCFIARLYETGLVGKTDAVSGTIWSERARSAGGCQKTAGK